MKLQFRELNDAELDQCEAVYDELFKIPSTGKILPPERFVARKPMDTDPHYRYFSLCAPAPDDQNEYVQSWIPPDRRSLDMMTGAMRIKICSETRGR